MKMNFCKYSLLRSISCLMLVLLCAAWTNRAEAQTRIPREVHLGVVGGANLSQYTFHPRVTQQFAGSYTMGVAARYIEETYFGLQAELLLTERVMSDLYEPNPEDFHFARKLMYVEMPVLAHVYFQMGKHNEVSIDLGPKLAWFMSDRTDSNLPDTYGISGTTAGNVYLHHELPVTKKFDYGIQGGLGYEFKVNEHYSAQIAGRYYFGLGNLWPDSKADNFEQSSNQSIQVILTLWWHHVIRGKKVKK